MSWLDNGVIRLGVDLNLGGAITWLSASQGPGPNVINSWDWGRQVQMSYYSGPVPYIVGHKRPAKVWEHIGWNPIQVGDDFGHRAQILEERNDGRSIYVKCIPTQWPLDNVPGECTFESWLELDGPCVRARCRINNARSDKTQYPARGQELPAVYTNGPYSRLIAYTGDRPFDSQPVTEIEAKGPPSWTHWTATENWTALVNRDGWGLGVWNPDCVHFGGGFAGKPGAGGPKDDPCGYISPQGFEILDHDIVHEYRYDLILGTVEEIRKQVYQRAKQPKPATWRFAQDRQSWTWHLAHDEGWRLQGEWPVHLDGNDPQLISPWFFCRAEDGPVLVIEAAFGLRKPELQVFWANLAGDMSEQNSRRFPVIGDGEFHEYRFRLADAPNYQGVITRLRIDPPEEPGAIVRLRSIRLER